MPVPQNTYKFTAPKAKIVPRKLVVRAAGTTGSSGGYGQTYPKGHKATN